MLLFPLVFSFHLRELANKTKKRFPVLVERQTALASTVAHFHDLCFQLPGENSDSNNSEAYDK